MPEVGHNANAGDSQKAFLLSQYMSSLETKKSADGKHSSLCDRLQKRGLDTKAANEAMKIHAAGDASEKIKYLRELAQCLRLLGTPLEDAQGELFAKPEGSQTPEERAQADGLRNGYMGHGQDKNPHAMNSEQGQAWMTGWHEGCAERKKHAEEFTAQELAEAENAEEPEEDGEQTDIEDAA